MGLYESLVELIDGLTVVHGEEYGLDMIGFMAINEISAILMW